MISRFIDRWRIWDVIKLDEFESMIIPGLVLKIDNVSKAKNVGIKDHFDLR
jgi:hypothetical protein